jgi:AcrR family transcriptional regulator
MAGLESLTIGALADRMQMSKSGVFAHFGSREDLQIAVLQAYEARFIDDVLKAAIAVPRGWPRLAAILERWLARTVIEAAQGCIWISAASEYDDRPGPVRDELVRMIEGWRGELGRAIDQAVTAGHLGPDTDVDELLFAVNGVVLALHHDARLMRNPAALDRARRAIDRLIERLRMEAAPAIRLADSSSRSNADEPAGSRPSGAARPTRNRHRPVPRPRPTH